MRGIVEKLPGVRALDCVELEIVPADVHYLPGENGAGKLTRGYITA